jgi:MFS transporter, FHS family, L-fucose permease
MQWQSQLVDFAFYVAYFVGSIIYFIISYVSGDPLHKIGYKKGLIIGLLISAVGALGFIPAASSASFALMLTSLFVVGLGFALQQIVANPYMIALGDPATGAHRVTLAGGVNSFGTTIGPLLVSFAIFGTISGTTDINIGVETVKIPYLFLASAFVLFAIIIAFSKLPAIATHEHVEKSLGAFKYPQLLLGMLAIFVYVGVEVSIQSNLPELIKQEYILGLDAQHAVHFISLYWGGLMIGRWTGAISAFNLSKVKRNILTVVVPIIAYAVILVVNYIKGSPVSDFYAYFPLVIILIGGFFIGKEKPAQTLMLFSILGGVMMLVGLFTTGKVALYSFLSGGLFCSIMWPCIFSLSIAGLGKYTTQGSSLLIMMILGGAIIPIIQGYLSDLTNIHFSYTIPVFCFAYLAFYAWRVKAILQKQGIDYDAATSGSGH